jgi:hypothetical protein
MKLYTLSINRSESAVLLLNFMINNAIPGLGDVFGQQRQFYAIIEQWKYHYFFYYVNHASGVHDCWL